MPNDLRPGDVLFYAPSSLLGVLISLKTWTWLSHVEAYVGSGRVIAARPQGVNVYCERIDKHLACIRRPLVKRFDVGEAYRAVSSMLGKSYDITAFWSFFLPQMNRNHATRICSSVVTAWLRGGGVEPFNPDFDSDDVSPAQLWQSSELMTIWKRNKKEY